MVSFRQMMKGDYYGVSASLEKIKDPEKLAASQKSYFHFIKGGIAAHSSDWSESELQFQQALNIGLRTKNDTHIAMYRLAQAFSKQGRKEEALVLLEQMYEEKLNPEIQVEGEKLLHEYKSNI